MTMSARAVRGWFLSVFTTVVLAVSCSSSKPPATVQCVYNSDCSGALKCSQGICENECTTSKDCNNGQERCISVVDAATSAPQFVCQPMEKSTCVMNSQCSPLYCSSDGQCRNQCAADVDCPYGVSGTHMKCAQDPETALPVCVDPVADAMNYDPTTNMVVPKPASAGGTTGGAGAGGSPAGEPAAGAGRARAAIR